MAFFLATGGSSNDNHTEGAVEDEILELSNEWIVKDNGVLVRSGDVDDTSETITL